VALAIGGLYGQILDNFFLNDDFGRILTVKNLEHLQPFDALISMFGDPLLSYYRPFTFLSFYTLLKLFGLKSWWYNLSAVGVHILSSLAVYWLARSLTDENESWRSWFALTVALFFAVHPRQVESVSYVHDNENTICGLFFFVGLLFFVSYCRTARLRHLACANLSYMFSLFGKEMGVTLPFVCLAYLLMVHRDRSGLRGVLQDQIVRRSTIAFGVTFLTYMALRYHALGVLVGGAGDTAKLEFSLVRMLRTFFQANIAMVVPNDLPGLESAAEFFRTHVLLFLLLCLVVAGVVVWKLIRLKSQRCWFGFSWCAISLLPILNNGIGVHELTGGRYLYITLAGLAICIADLAFRVLNLRSVVFAVTLVLALLAGCTYRNNALMVYASRLSEGFLKGLDNVVAHPRDGRTLVLVPRMYKGIYVLNGIDSGVVLLYGNRATEFTKRVSELSLQINREGPVEVGVNKEEGRNITVALGEGASFLWSEQVCDTRTMESMGLHFSKTRSINSKGDFTAKVVQLSLVEAIVHPNFQDPDAKNIVTIEL
jgi:hypothetical protein